MSSNYDAKSIQEALRMLGHPLATDGINGPKTQAAIKDFQKSAGVGVDGIVGPKTAAAFASKLGEISREPSAVSLPSVGHNAAAPSAAKLFTATPMSTHRIT